VLVAAVLLAAVLYATVCGVVALALTRNQRFPLERTPAAFGLSYQDVVFPSRVDRLTLRGWLIAPAATADAARRPVVAVHGRGGNRERGPGGGLLEIVAHLAAAGHPVLTFDLRGAGESGGDRFTLGAQEVRDVGGAVDFLAERGLAPDGVDVVGFSLGAATAVLQGGADARVRAVVEDSGYADLGDILAEQVPALSGLPALFTPGTILMARPLLGVDAYAIRPARSAQRLAARGVPLLVIHGEADRLVPVRHGRRLAAAYGPAAETLFVPGAGHVRAYVADPAAYLARLLPFLARA
jgi:pimeloyl-ACP methyl ester carboxylesterase